MDGFQLRRGNAGVVAEPVGGHLEAILDEGDQPTHQHRQPKGRPRVLEMAVPGEGHEDVGYGEENEGGDPHGEIFAVGKYALVI